jgi:hypothetical protein
MAGGGSWTYVKTRGDGQERNLAMLALEQRFKALEQDLGNLSQTMEQDKTAYAQQLEQIKEQAKIPGHMTILCADDTLLLAKEAFVKARLAEAVSLTNAAAACLPESMAEIEALKTALTGAMPPYWNKIAQDLSLLNDDVAILDAPRQNPKPEEPAEHGWRRFWSGCKTEVAKLFVVEDDALLDVRSRLQLYLSSAVVFAQTHDAEKTLALLDAVHALILEHFSLQDKKVKQFLEKNEALKQSLGSTAMGAFDQAIAAIQARIEAMRK